MTASLGGLAAILVAALVLVVATSSSLPPVVASHFGAGGLADGFMSRAGYVTFMLVMMVGMAGLFVGVPKLLRILPTAVVNLPNRDYWLAPERKDVTLDDVGGRMRWLACAMLALLAYVHWLVVRANAAQPAVLPQPEFFWGLAGFAIAVIAWLVAFFSRFRLPR